MKNNKKIKDIYNCDYITYDRPLYSLEEWTNQLIDKNIDELTILDIQRMLRQEMFMEPAIPKAIDLLRSNIFAGELYDGQILDDMLTVDYSYIAPYQDELKDILKNAYKRSHAHEWSYDEEKREFDAVVRSMLERLKLKI